MGCSHLGLRPRCLREDGAGNEQPLLAFPGNLYAAHFSCLVFLANSSRVKLFNNIFSSTQPAEETPPKPRSCLYGLVTSGRPGSGVDGGSYDLKSLVFV